MSGFRRVGSASDFIWQSTSASVGTSAIQGDAAADEPGSPAAECDPLILMPILAPKGHWHLHLSSMAK
jgi:hypothetical protein